MAGTPRRFIVFLGLGLVLGMGDACVADPEHCASSGVACGDGLVCDPCASTMTSPNGCVSEADVLDAMPDVDGCQSGASEATTDLDPTIGEVDGTSTTETPVTTTTNLDTTATGADTEADTTTGPPPICDDPDGTYGVDCPGDGTRPFCVDMVCVGCNNDILQTNCGNVDGAPGMVCADDGRCVACTTEDTLACPTETPACDPATNACVPCTEHAQCGDAACNLFTGECVAGMVVNVVPGAGALDNAVAMVNAGGGGTIRLADGLYDEAIFVAGGVVAFLAEPGASPEWRRTTGVGAPQLRVTGGATALVEGIEFHLNTSSSDPGLRVDAANSRLWVDRSSIAQNNGVSIRAEAEAELVLRNCFVGGDNNVDVLDVTTDATARVLYSTLAAEFGSSNAVSCDASATDMVTVNDSILIARDSTAEIACTELVADHTATNTMMLPGAGNVTVGNTDDVLWFENYNTGDFRLLPDGATAFDGIAQWNVGDPLVDIDGEPRVGVEGEMEQAGADVIP